VKRQVAVNLRPAGNIQKEPMTVVAYPPTPGFLSPFLALSPSRNFGDSANTNCTTRLCPKARLPSPANGLVTQEAEVLSPEAGEQSSPRLTDVPVICRRSDTYDLSCQIHSCYTAEHGRLPIDSWRSWITLWLDVNFKNRVVVDYQISRSARRRSAPKEGCLRPDQFR